ncbi:MAG: hypothetical protein FWF81_05575 [Defluviitaleaceae bacterium]|nr:hypothetical protein [Defluviitaleaceae bacterium]
MTKKLAGLFFIIILTISTSAVVIASEYPQEMRELSGVTVRMSASEWMKQYSQHNVYSNSSENSFYNQDLIDAVLNGDYVYVTTFHLYYCNIDGTLRPVENMGRNVIMGNVIVRAVWWNHNRIDWYMDNLRNIPTWINGTTRLYCRQGILRDIASINLSLPALRPHNRIASLNIDDSLIFAGVSNIQFLQDGFNAPPNGPDFSMHTVSRF